ncbi:MAG: pilus assembly protein TadG-related protein [Chloroflexota bacterium]
MTSWLRRKTLDLFEGDNGAVVVLVALASVTLMGFVATVLDVGMMYDTRHQLQKGVDGAALAGGWELPQSPDTAATKAREYAVLNGIMEDEISSVSIVSLFNPNDGLEIRAQRTVGLTFARTLGLNTAVVEASATAIVAQIQPEGMLPLGLPEAGVGDGYSVLKLGAPGMEGAPGSFRAIDFPPTGGAADYEHDIKYGWDNWGVMPPYNPPAPYSWWVSPKTGNMVGPTKDAVDFRLSMSAMYDPPSCILADPYGYDPDNPPPGFSPHIEGWRIGYVPIVSDESWEAAVGKSQPVEIIGFAAFYLIGYTNAPGGHIEVHGVFLKTAKGVGTTIVGAPLEGLIGARLWR